MSDFQRVRGDGVAVKVGVVYGEIGRMDDRMSMRSVLPWTGGCIGLLKPVGKRTFSPVLGLHSPRQ